MNIGDVTTAHVMKVLEPIWATRTQTAKKLRARIENVLGWATTSGFRTGDNPARWKGHLENLLAKPSAVYKVQHMPALSTPTCRRSWWNLGPAPPAWRRWRWKPSC